MKVFRPLLAVLLVCFAASAAFADTFVPDPVIIVRGGQGSINITTPGTIPLTYLAQPGCTNQSYLIPSLSPTPLPGMECVFKNMLPNAITSMTISITSAQLPLTLQCALICSSFTATPTGGLATFVFNPPLPNYPPNFEIAIDFVNFLGGTTFGVTPNPVPEPGTLLLLMTGVSAMAVRRRLRA